MSTIDQQFVEYIVKSVVGNPDAVVVERTVDERGVLLELTVAPEDLGRVIGKRGSGAQALRTLLRALGTKNDARYNLKIVDDGQSASDVKSGVQESEEPTNNTTDSSDTEEENSRVAQTRKELEDLDDLDI
ncbi:MAG: KH domain-containing protein [Candidatus Nomurabacteria bacterium]|nr:MAG: KH domain-containing protein [Candidatus Nomurabacteria bacterium]